MTSPMLFFRPNSLHVPCACASIYGHGVSIRQFHVRAAQMAFQMRDGFSFLGTSLRAAFFSLIRAEPDQHYYHVRRQTSFSSPLDLTGFPRKRVQILRRDDSTFTIQK